MTLNEWEQNNIEVLTSREMGEWLCRRENRLLEQIRAEIQENINYNKKMNYQGIVAGLLLTLDIIDKYKGDKE